MAGNVNHTDSAETTRSGGTRKRPRLETLPVSTGPTEERGLGLGAVPGSATGGLAATWSTSQAAVERGAARLPGWLRRVGRYGLALLFVAVAAVLRWALSDVLSPTPFLVFYLAWVGAAVFGGLGPGLLATVASWVCVEFLFDSTPGQVGFTDPMSIARLMILLAGGLAVSLVGEKMRRSRIHERRQVRTLAELAQSLEREKGILQSVMSGARNSHLVYLDRDFNFVRVNEAYARTRGYTPEEMIGKNHFALYPHAENEAIFSRVRDTGVPVEVHDKPFVFPDQPERGTTYWDWTLTPIKNDSGYVEGLVFSLFETTQRKQAEETLKVKDSAIASSLNAVAMGDLQGRLTYVNPAFLRLWGYEDECEVLGKPVSDFWKEPEQALETIQAIRNGEGWTGELVAVAKDGSLLDISLSASTVLNDGGTPICMMASFVDITERKRAEEALRAKQAELELILNRTPFMLTRCTRDLHYRYVSRAYAEMIGRTPDQVAGKPIVEIMGEEGFETIRPYVEAVLQGQLVEYEAPVHFQGVGPRFLHVAYAPDMDEQGHVIGWIASIIDITQRKRGEEALRESEEKYRRIVETATEGIVMVDANARVVFANDRWSEIFGYSLEEARHMTHFEMVFPEDRAEMTERWESRKRGVKENYEFRFRRKDGSPIWVLIGVAPRFDPEGGFLGTLVMAADITERKRAEEALRELNATLESRVAQRTAELEDRAKQLQKLTLELTEAESRERKRLAGILHDDLQQVLAAAKFHLGLVGNQYKSDKTLQEMTRQVEALLVEAIDKSRRLSRELSPPGLAHNDLRETFEWLASQVQAKHGLTVHVDVRDQIELQSEPLKALLFKAAQEMLFNVVKHAQVREARLRLRRRGGNICLAVSDKGRGFDPQGPESTAGSGLPGIRERVHLLGGHMKVRSAKGKGSTFLIVVPDSAQQTNQTDHT